MKIIYNKCWKKVLLVLILLTIVRELEFIDLSYYNAKHRLNITSLPTNTDGAGIDSLTIAYEVEPAFVDYLPIYKTRTFTGRFDHRIGRESADFRLQGSYTIELAVFGFCSGYHFRKLAETKLKETIFHHMFFKMNEDEAMLPWFDGDSTLSVEQLLELEGIYRADSMITAFESAIRRKADETGLANLTDAERTVLAVEDMEREVNNGGFDQLFINSSRETVPYLVDSLEAIGCAKVSDMARAAISALCIEGDLTAQKIEQVIFTDDDPRDELLNAIDDRYYREAGDIATPLLAFIKANKAHISW